MKNYTLQCLMLDLHLKYVFTPSSQKQTCYLCMRLLGKALSSNVETIHNEWELGS